MKKKHWYDYLWIWSIIYFTLGFFNILFAWLGMIDFLVPVFIAVFGRNKWFCNNLCGRGQLFALLGGNINVPGTGRRPGFSYRPGSVTVFWPFSWLCSEIWCFRPGLWRRGLRDSGRRSNCSGPLKFHGAGLTPQEWCRTGWPSTASGSTA